MHTRLDVVMHRLDWCLLRWMQDFVSEPLLDIEPLIQNQAILKKPERRQ
jgi:hypothetical protein